MAVPAKPHGGHLVTCLPTAPRPDVDWPQHLQHRLTPRQCCDLELIVNGGFSPLVGFLNESDYNQVLNEGRLADGTLWPIPVTLDVPASQAEQVQPGDALLLLAQDSLPLAYLAVESVWPIDRRQEARQIYGSEDPNHPGVATLLYTTHDYYVGGSIRLIQPIAHHDFLSLRHTPTALRADFATQDHAAVIAFQTRNPMHRAHQALTLAALKAIGGHLLLHPTTGIAKPGDIDHYTRVRCYQHLLPTYPPGSVTLALLPLAMRMAGPREAIWHAIIRQNYGCSHIIIGRDHAGPGQDANSQPFYAPYAAQDAVQNVADELDIVPLCFHDYVYVPTQDSYQPHHQVKADTETRSLSGTALRERLRQGQSIPTWFSYPDVIETLRQRYCPQHKRGFTVLLTGLSGAGKSTLARGLEAALLERGGRTVSLLDGDEIRQHLSHGLGFSKADRDRNILRIAFVAAEINRHHGVALCAPIAPFAATRAAMRRAIEAVGGIFIEVYVATPLACCEARDSKGLYARARRGELQEVTGIDSPYEVPTNPDLILDTSIIDTSCAVERLLKHLEQLNVLRQP